MSGTTLARNLDGAKLVWYVRERGAWGAVFAWFGGHGVNVYDAETGAEMDFFNVGSFEDDAAAREDVEAGIKDWLREWDEEYA